MHEILILFVIAIIVGFQIKIFLDAAAKIDYFKTMVPDASTFETVKVFIPESQIKDIKIEYILNNLQKFQNPLGVLENFETKEIDETVEEERSPIADHFKEEAAEPMIEEIIDYESLIWIAKGSEEKKIKFKFLKSHEILGWNRIQ
jgi:hypothetical protein